MKPLAIRPFAELFHPHPSGDFVSLSQRPSLRRYVVSSRLPLLDGMLLELSMALHLTGVRV